MAILHTHRDTITVLERVRVFVQNERVVYEQAEGGLNQQWNLPFANTACLLLGTGSSLTVQAANLLSKHGVMVGMTSGGGTPIFYGSLSEYRPTEYLQKWITFWPDPEKRLFAAKTMAKMRCELIEHCIVAGPLSYILAPYRNITETFRYKIDEAYSISSLMGFEGVFCKNLYNEFSNINNIEWNKRNNQPTKKFPHKKDRSNTFLDRGNYMAYGCASVVLWCLGIPPSLPVTHGASRAGGLVFDLADVFKDALVLPRAFHSAFQNDEDQEFRNKLLSDFKFIDLMPRLFSVIKELIELMD